MSQSTVSRALRNDAAIPQETRERVHGLARELGYEPDTIYSVMAERRRSAEGNEGACFAWIYDPGSMSNQELAGARERAQQYGYRIEPFTAADYRSPEHLANVLERRHVAGVVFGRVHFQELADRFPFERFPCVSCGLGYVNFPLDVISVDQVEAVRLGGHMAADRGYRNIGTLLLREDEALDFFGKSAAGHELQRELASHQVTASVLSLPIAALHTRECQRRVTEWVKEKRLDVVIGYNDLIYWILRDCGFRIPDDLGFLSLILAAEGTPGITGFEGTMKYRGSAAVARLDQLVRQGARGKPVYPLRIQIQPVWREGNTLPKRSADPVDKAVRSASRPAPTAREARTPA